MINHISANNDHQTMPQLGLLIFLTWPTIESVSESSKILNFQGPVCQLRSNVQYASRWRKLFPAILRERNVAIHPIHTYVQ